MKTSDRTLLQTLGFADPDRATPERSHLHDMAVRYLMQPEVALALWRRFGNPDTVKWLDAEPVPVKVSATPEVLVKARSGFVVGFADLVLRPAHDCELGRVVVEVKTTLADAGSAVRQLRLYTNSLGYWHTDQIAPVLAVVEPISGDARAIVKAAGIGLATFGPGLQAFLAAPRSAEPDIEL